MGWVLLKTTPNILQKRLVTKIYKHNSLGVFGCYRHERVKFVEVGISDHRRTVGSKLRLIGLEANLGKFLKYGTNHLQNEALHGCKGFPGVLEGNSLNFQRG